VNDIKSFIIHLERAELRKANVEALLRTLPDAEVVLAVDGREMAQEQRDALVAEQSAVTPKYPFKLSLGEIGCFASHRKCWQKICDEDLPMALIVEDDVNVEAEAFSTAVSNAKGQLGSKGYIQFQVREVKQPTHLVAKGEAQILRPQLVPLRTSAQLVSQGAAKRLLELSSQIDRPVDTWVQMYWETGVDVFCAVPSGVSDLTNASGGSTVSTGRNLLQKVRAEFLRAIYRRKITTLSEEHWPY
jgi:GR25 family glycosyltransferase involved in LPS biosynthesis